MRSRILVAVMSFALVGALGACGNKKDRTLSAENEGIYVDLGALKYQVQISRPLNAAQPEDSEFLKGVTQQLTPQETWFGVFVRVQNESGAPQRPATEYEIDDTQDEVFRPIPLNPDSNVFAYVASPIPGKGVLPNVNTVAAQTSINGQLLLFRMPRSALDDRPLELRIHDPANTQTVATINLDV